MLFVLKSIPRFPSQLEKLKTLLLAPSLQSLARNLLCGVAPLFASFLTLYKFMSALRFLACLETDRVYSVRSRDVQFDPFTNRPFATYASFKSQIPCYMLKWHEQTYYIIKSRMTNLS